MAVHEADMDNKDPLKGSVSPGRLNMVARGERERLEELVRERTAELAASNEELRRKIKQHEEMEVYVQANFAFMRLMNEADSRQEYLDGVVRELRALSRCRHVGIKVLNRRGRLPYESTLGFDEEFLRVENRLSLSNDNCICTRLIKGTCLPQDKPCITPKGSFRCGNMFDFLAGLSADERTQYRGVCTRRGYASLAIVPLSYRGMEIGAIHLADEREGVVTLRLIETIESFAPLIGEALTRFDIREKLQQQVELQSCINALLRLSLEDIHLDDLLQQTLEIILSSPRLSWTSIGAIFVKEEDSENLTLKAQRGFSQDALQRCSRIPPGKWFCGDALLEREPTLVSCSSTEIPQPCTPPLGHCCIPILLGGRVLGMISLCIKPEHEWDPGEEEFLGAVANTLAGIIHRRTMEESLYKSERLFRTLVETMNEGMASQDENGIINFANEKYCKLFGFQCSELIGRRLLDLFSEADRPHFLDQIAHRRKGEPGDYEIRHLTKDGKEIPVHISSSPIIDDNGIYRGSIGVITDISARKQADEQLQLYMNRLEQSNRALQDFAFMASHDLQEPLRKIQTFGGRIKTRYGQALGEEGRDYLARMLSAAQRMQTLIQALLNYSRITTRPEPFVPVNLNVVVQSVLKDLEVRIEQSGGRVQVNPLPVIEADPTQMQQLFQNLIVNALKYHGDRPPVVRIAGAESSAGEILLSIEDNGIGFEEKYAERIFSPFQRLHGRSEYEGSGMGLAICRKIVERHGGTITAHSKPGEGSTFLIKMPVRQPAGDNAGKTAGTS